VALPSRFSDGEKKFSELPGYLFVIGQISNTVVVVLCLFGNWFFHEIGVVAIIVLSFIY
jgi:hypothetical protein